MILFNQKYWEKLQRKEWLVNGDRNTTFFQRRANTRRKKKIIIKLRDDCSLWINDHKAIVDKFTTNFSKRFKSSHNEQCILAHLELPSLISDLDNSELIKLPDLEEVKIALFNIDSNKTPGLDGLGAGFSRTSRTSLKKTCSTVS